VLKVRWVSFRRSASLCPETRLDSARSRKEFDDGKELVVAVLEVCET